ncbi:pkb-activating kinase-like protein [Tulasnella sp. 403]|nr:pkb-activating kinase-like protein [Tulasnella sp. 403]
MAAPVLTLSSASSSSSSNAYIANQTGQSSESQQHATILATLSRNASVISTSSSSSSSSSIVPPVRPRPLRTFSNHSASTARARSPNNGHPRSPTTPTRGIPAAYLPRSLSPPADRLAPMAGFGGAGSPVSSRPGSRHASRPPNDRSRSNSSIQRGITAADFEFGDVLGSGSYSSVISATHRNSGQIYAIKMIDKAHIIRHRKTKYATIEKTCLARLGTGNWKGNSNPKSPERNHQRKASGIGGGGHPGVIKMHWAFHDEMSLYFVLDLAPNGELLTHIRRLGSLSYLLVKYYTAQLVDTLQYIHSMNILHRDVKPENVLLDAERRIKITDFGSAKLLDEDKSATTEGQDEQRSSSFVGSALYVSPELLTKNSAGKGADVWALGSIIYYMIAGDPPFKAMSEYLTFERIKRGDYSFPPDDSSEAFDPEAKDLIQKILVSVFFGRLEVELNFFRWKVLDPASRYSLQQVRTHQFLASINYATLWVEPAPPAESGVRRNLSPVQAVGMDGDIGDAWDQLVGEDEDDLNEGPLGPADSEMRNGPGPDPELDRVMRMYGKGKAVATADDRAVSSFPSVHEVEERATPNEDTVGELSAQPMNESPKPIPGELPTPKPLPPRQISPTERNSRFVVVSRRQSGGPSISKAIPPIDAVAASPTAIPPGPASACSSSEGSPVEPAGAHMPHNNGLGLFTRVWGRGARRGSSSSTTGAPGFGGLGLSVWSNSRRTSFGSSTGKRLSPDLRSTPGSRRMSSTSGSGGPAHSASTRSSSTSRKGSWSGGVFGERSEMGQWSGIFLPGEQVLFHSPIHLRHRRGLLPSKRRVLVLTDLPRLLCIKEHPDRFPSPSGSSPKSNVSVVVKTEVVFSPTTSTTRPPVLTKISESQVSSPVAEGEDESGQLDSSTEEAAVPPRVRRGSSFALHGATGRSILSSVNFLKGVEAKGDRQFAVRTTWKTYMYIAEDASAAAQWVKEIEDVRANMQCDPSGLAVPPQASS